MDLMHHLQEEGLRPATIPFAMNAALEGLNGNRYAKLDFFYNSNYTADGICYPRKGSEFSGRFKVNPASKLLIGVKRDLELVQGALQLSSDEAYASLDGIEFVRVSIGDVKRRINGGYAILAPKFNNIKTDFTFDKERRWYVPTTHIDSQDYWLIPLYDLGATPLFNPLGITKAGGKEIDEVRNSDLWLALAHYDFKKDPNHPDNQAARELISRYQDIVLRAISQDEEAQVATGKEIMSIFLGTEAPVPTIRALQVEAYGVGIIGFGNLDDYVNNQMRLVGVEPEGSSRTYTQKDIERAEEAVEKLRNAEEKRLIEPGIIESLEALLRRL